MSATNGQSRKQYELKIMSLSAKKKKSCHKIGHWDLNPQNVAAVSCSLVVYRLGGAGLGFGMTGKLGQTCSLLSTCCQISYKWLFVTFIVQFQIIIVQLYTKMLYSHISNNIANLSCYSILKYGDWQNCFTAVLKQVLDLSCLN